MEPQTFKEVIIQNIDSIEQCIFERACHEQELQNRLKRLNERKLQIQECMVQKVKASDASLGEKDCSRIVSDKGNDQGLENDQGLKNQSNTYGDESSRSRNECNDKSTSRDDADIRPSYDIEPMFETDHNAVKCDDERVVLANLIANLKRDIDENKTIQNQLKKANASLTQELKECKSTLVETSKTLGESNSIRDSCLVALQNKQTEFERYKAFNDHTVDYEKLKRKLNETLGLLAQKEIDIKEGLKVKAYEILVVKEKHDELVKHSLLTKSHYEGLVKEKTKNLANPLVIRLCYDFQYPTIGIRVKHSKDHFRAPTAKDMEILIKTCLMHLALKTQNDSHAFFHELKKEMHADLKYVESLENEIYEQLKSDKAEFSNMYDILLQECVSNDVMCSYLHSLSDLDAHFKLQCLYLHKVNECECLAQNLLKQTKFPQVRKSSFAKPYDVNAPGPSRNSQKHASFQSPRKSVGLNDMVHNYYLEEAMKKAQLQKDKALNTKHSVQQSARLPNIANAVEKKSESKNHGRQIPIGQRFFPNKSSNVYLKTTPPRSGITWKTTGRIFTQVDLKWIPLESTSMAFEPIYSKGSSNVQTTEVVNLIPAESNSLPHAHTQTTKTYYKHQDSRIKNAQNTKTFANFDIQDLRKSYQEYQDNDVKGYY
ncbi:hypothetical protein Tco_0409603 [Tanacetum coccineum]